jgi:hypothetical protein
MADPTDRDAIAEIEISTGCQVVPALATLSQIDEAIARAYRGFVTAVMRPPEAEPAPARRKVPFGGDLAVHTPALQAGDPAPGAGVNTEPFHSLEDEAPPELRHRALLEVLAAKGLISLDEYHAEIRRLLKERG